MKISHLIPLLLLSALLGGAIVFVFGFLLSKPEKFASPSAPAVEEARSALLAKAEKHTVSFSPGIPPTSTASTERQSRKTASDPVRPAFTASQSTMASRPGSTGSDSRSQVSSTNLSATSSMIVQSDSVSLPSESSAGVQSTASPSEIAIDVPFGASAPAAFMEDGVVRTPQQAAALDQIAQDFNDEVAGLDRSNDSETAKGWQKAVEVADERYRLIFGDDAYNRLQTQAALEALQEKQSAIASPSPAPAN